MIALIPDVKKYPDAYQAERAGRLDVSEKSIGHALQRMNISKKKRCSAPKLTKTNGTLSKNLVTIF